MINDFINRQDLMLFTSAGRLMMAAVYQQSGHAKTVATFDLFIRELPDNRNYFVFAGLEHVLDYLVHFRFSPSQLRFIQRSFNFSPKIFRYFKNLRFTGDVYAMPEGTICFPNEPVIRITAPIAEAALVEQYLINTVMLQTMLASKLSRVVHSARGKEIAMTFTRSHGVEPGVKATRVGALVGIKRISLPMSAERYGVPVTGASTFHHFFQAFDTEQDAFEAYAQCYPGRGLMLVDTYDTIQGLKQMIKVSKRYGARVFRGVMLDSGNMLTLSKKGRRMLDEGGMDKCIILAMGNLNEYKINELEQHHAPVDWYGVSTEALTSFDAPKLEVVYKLAEIIKGGSRVSKMKLSKNKVSLPGRKQIFRQSKRGRFIKDIIGLAGEQLPGEPLLKPYIKNGRMIHTYPSLDRMNRYYDVQMKKFHPSLFSIAKKVRYPVQISPGLRKLSEETRHTIIAAHRNIVES